MTRLWPTSIQARMIALSLVATLIALGLAAWAIGGVLERFVIQGLDRRLDGEIAALASAVGPDGRVDMEQLRERRALADGGPGWAWRIAGPHGSVQSDALPALRPPRPPRGPRGEGPPPPPADAAIQALDGGAAHARQYRFATRDGPVTITAVAPQEVVERPIRAAIMPLLIALAIVGGLLALASLVQLRLGLKPLRRIRDELTEMRRGQRERISDDQPAELLPLADELNALAEHNRRALEAARLSAANLAHALKTPVTALALDLAGDPARAAKVDRLSHTIRHHLARARAQAVDIRSSSEVGAVIDDLCETLLRMRTDGELRIERRIAEGLMVAVDRHDLLEMCGNLLDNAARFAASRLVVESGIDPTDARWIEIRVEDDGTGIPAEVRERLGRRGERLDERQEGYGLGLSISAELAELYGGSLTLAESSLGGLLAKLRLPRA